MSEEMSIEEKEYWAEYDREEALLRRWAKLKGESYWVLSCADIAQYSWCDEYAQLEWRFNEPNVFMEMVGINIQHLMPETFLNLMENDPESDESFRSLLDVAERLSDEELLEVGEVKGDFRPDLRVVRDIYDDPVLFDDDRIDEIFKKSEGLESKEAGRELEELQDVLPTVPWVFKRGNFYIVTFPDGIDLEKSCCYEFKTMKKPHYRRYDEPVASLQADLGAYLFGLDNIKVDMWAREDAKGRDRQYVKERPADYGDVEKVLGRVERILNGSMFTRGPTTAPWKCGICEWFGSCRIQEAKGNGGERLR